MGGGIRARVREVRPRWKALGWKSPAASIGQVMGEAVTLGLIGGAIGNQGPPGPGRPRKAGSSQAVAQSCPPCGRPDHGAPATPGGAPGKFRPLSRLAGAGPAGRRRRPEGRKAWGGRRGSSAGAVGAEVAASGGVPGAGNLPAAPGAASHNGGGAPVPPRLKRQRDPLLAVCALAVGGRHHPPGIFRRLGGAARLRRPCRRPWAKVA